MSSFGDVKESWYTKIDEEINEFHKKLDEKIDKEQKQLKAQRKKNELESKMAQELKLNAELTQQLSELSRRSCELEQACATLKSRLTIADSDRTRLENAKDSYMIAKELTGIRFDYTAPPDLAKGYIKSESRRQLQAFEVPASEAPTALWALVGAAAAPAWPRAGKENRPRNK